MGFDNPPMPWSELERTLSAPKPKQEQGPGGDVPFSASAPRMSRHRSSAPTTRCPTPSSTRTRRSPLGRRLLACRPGRRGERFRAARAGAHRPRRALRHHPLRGGRRRGRGEAEDRLRGRAVLGLPCSAGGEPRPRRQPSPGAGQRRGLPHLRFYNIPIHYKNYMIISQGFFFLKASFIAGFHSTTCPCSSDFFTSIKR